MYALRDVTATVESIPLIVASILSKKLAEGIDGLVLDVKVGRGAFMKDEADARRLAQALVDTGTRAGKKVVAILTDMSAPLGVAVGNANETREALEVLHGRRAGRPARVHDGARRGDAPRRRAREGAGGGARPARPRHRRGAARQVMERMVAAQGGDAKVVTEPDRLHVAPAIKVLAESAGIVTGVDPLEIGLAAVALGAGRTRADQTVDPSVGVMVLAKPGARVDRGT